MVQRIYVEKKPDLALEARALLSELKAYVGLDNLTGLRLVNRYDVEGLSRADFEAMVKTVFSEPQTDLVFYDLPKRENERVLALEFLPGQFDQRADSAAQCVQLRTQGERPLVRSARIYLLEGDLTQEDMDKVRRHLINPVESREASLEKPDSLKSDYPKPLPPHVMTGFNQMDEEALKALQAEHSLAMDLDDLKVCQRYFASEGRDPVFTEIKVIDTYWSDHCRHTTFLTEITDVVCEDPVIKKTLDDYFAAREKINHKKPFTLMDVGTFAARALKKDGKLPEYEQTEENNACTLKIKVDTKQGEEDWLLFFKNETHNHPTEIEPFGGAATCIGGAIRDPLSARSYVYAGMRVTGAGDPTTPIEDTLKGKLPQRRICQTAAAGFASYGNQIGLATGCVHEIYHEGYVAKRMEAGAVLGAAKFSHVRRERPAAGDVILLLGGRTGRDGIGGATGSSMAHTLDSVDECAAQVQKGNAPEERKLQRLFRKPEASKLIKRCNDFGAGGVSVAIGELARGLQIDLDRVKVKYEGLDATELAISESQERMAVVVEEKDVAEFSRLASEENLECTPVAVVTSDERLVMTWQGHTVVDIARDFLDENGARKYIKIKIEEPRYTPFKTVKDFASGLLNQANDLNLASQEGLIERFDSTIGAASVLLPLGGKNQKTRPAAMVHALPVPGGTDTCSFMSFGYNPHISEKSPYHGAYLAVVESVAALVAAGSPVKGIYLSFQEFFPKPGSDAKRWGLPLAAVLGAYRAQMELGYAAIGGKDSMSGTFEHLDVPPTLISFAVNVGKKNKAFSPEFKQAGSPVVWLKPEVGEDGLPDAESFKTVLQTAETLLKEGKALSCLNPARGGAARALVHMAQGNGIGVDISTSVPLDDLFSDSYGSLILELKEDLDVGIRLGVTVSETVLTYGQEKLPLSALNKQGEALMDVYPMTLKNSRTDAAPLVTSKATPTKGKLSVAKPRVLIPAFPGTNCEEDTAVAFERAGARPHVFVIRNQTASDVAESVAAFAELIKNSQILFLPGGFSGGDEPDGSGKFITAFLGAKPVGDALQELLNKRYGLVGGICNGFQALVKSGLLPSGQLTPPDGNSPTLTANEIGRHQSRLVRVRVASRLSPWFARYEAGETYTVPISHGEGRFLCTQEQFDAWAAAGQIAAQYADMTGKPSMDIRFNPSGSAFAIEALTSPDGRVMGRMGHSERMLKGLYQNVPNSGHDPLFESAVDFFR